MRKHVLPYGLLCGLLIAALQFIEYRWIVVEHSIEIYSALIAAVFAALGLWLGNLLSRRSAAVPVPEIVIREILMPAPQTFERDERQVAALGLTPRELEILALIADGLSNREIAARVFVSENTVKTHSNRVFGKLGAQRRTQAVQRGKQLRLIP